jgi:hypothetical protein
MASGKIEVIPVITPAKILEPSSKELASTCVEKEKLDTCQSTDGEARESLC